MSAAKPLKSVITCDMEGRIETFNEGAEQIFGYSADEVIGTKRVSLFSPGLVVLGHVGNWLKTADREGTFETRTVFERKDGTAFAAKVRIRPTKRDGEQIGYCGVTEPLDDVSVEEAMPKISFGTRLLKWLVITRAPFLTATIVPILIAAAWVGATTQGAFPWLAFTLAMIGGCALHLAANTFNDYFDWKSGADEANKEYFQAFSGGSRAIELRLISPEGVFRVGLISSLVALATGIGLLTMVGPSILWFGVAGLFSAYFYTAPPLRLVARKGLGELLIGLNFGPLMVAGTVFAMTGSVSWLDFLVGLPVGLLTTAILWINEFPDAESDAATGKNNLVVVLGKDVARYGYAVIVGAAFAVVAGLVVAGLVPAGALAFLLGLPLAVYATRVLFKHFRDRQLVKACVATIQLQLVAGVAMALGLFFFAG
jgi:1,4-dihydroxy-2-naphthoate polyprenyltransferase